jgi:hypothetical protein
MPVLLAVYHKLMLSLKAIALLNMSAMLALLAVFHESMLSFKSTFCSS